MLFSIGRFLAAALLAALVGGCAPAGNAVLDWRDPEVDLVWPAPPDPPRVEFLRSLSGPLDFVDRSGKASRFFRWLSGETTQGVPMLAPYGVAADGRGRVWVADAGSLVVHVFDLSRRRVDYLSAAGRQPFASPVGVAYDTGRDRLFVSDSVLNKVFVFDGEGEFRGLRLPSGGFGRPGGLAVDDAGRLYVADVSKGLVEIFDADGTHIESRGSRASGDGLFSGPSNLFVDAGGRLYVTDSLHFRVEVFGSKGESLGIIGRLGDGPGSFARPRGVAVDSFGHVYVADAAFDNIQVFDMTGRLLLFFGLSGEEVGRFRLPAGLFCDRDNRIYVVDSYNRRLQIFQYVGGGGDLAQ